MSDNGAAWQQRVEPDARGPAGRAWRFTYRLPADDLRSSITVDRWLLHAPMAHPFWSWYVMAAIALRDVEGLGPAYRQYPAAEYELMVIALNPDFPPPDPRFQPDGMQFLTPADQVLQFDDVPGGDDGVRRLMSLVAAAVTAGTLSPDQDWREHWRVSLDATLDHVRRGLHE